MLIFAFTTPKRDFHSFKSNFHSLNLELVKKIAILLFQASTTSIQMSPRKPSTNGVENNMNGSELNHRNGHSDASIPKS